MARTEVRGGQILDTSVSLTADVTGTLLVANGGTGNATLTNNAVLTGAGTGAIGGVAPSTSGNVLVSNGTAWASGRQTARISTLTVSGSTYTPAGDTTDIALITSPAANFTVAAPSGTPADGQRLMLRIKSDATGRTPTWNPIYQSSGVATLPTTALPASKTCTFGFIYDSTAVKWVALAQDTTGY